MLELTMDMEQYDCPFIDTSDDHDVAYSAVQWSFDRHRRRLETRIVADAADVGALDQGLDALDAHPNMHSLDLIARRGDQALLRTVIGETEAMSAIRSNDGYITGPFYIEDGSELWQVGFDNATDTDQALSDLDRNNEFTIEHRSSIDIDALFEVMNNVESAAAILESIRDLSDVERDTLAAAVRHGYFEEPRTGTLDTIAAEFDVSDSAVSKNLRRAKRKVLPSVLDAGERLS